MEKLAAPWPGVVAVSGGGDSLALMHLLSEWARRSRREPPVVLTVNHRLQPRSAANARRVVDWAKKAGLKAHVLTWTGARPRADIEAEARQVRYALMGAWCRKRGIEALYVGHTRDDQAETFLLRLARGSGLDGLAAMRAVSPYPVEGFQGLRLVRPMIGLDRNELRAHLTARGQEWFEDPMNADPRFSRVRVRAAMDALTSAGLTSARIADAAVHLGRAREALDAVTAAVIRQSCRADGKAILIEAGALRAAPREVGLRVLAQILMKVGSQDYRPRFERLEALFDAIHADHLGNGRTLHGCRIAPAPGSQAYFGTDTLLIAPEPARTATKTAQTRRKL